MSHPPRWILVDDTNPDIKYTETSWFAFTGNPISNEVWGLPYQNTLHGTNSSASLTYNFKGSAVRVRGTAHSQNISGIIDPTWECFVDGIRIDNLNVTSLQNSNYCEGSGLNDGQHTLTVTTTVTRQKTFWFDRIEYVPSAGVPLEDKTLLVPTYRDPAFQYSSGWDNGATGVLGASVSFDFVGTSLIWYTEYKQNYSSSRTTATWSIDDQAAQTVTLPDHERGSNSFNQKLFDTGTLAMGTHRLTVTYNGVSNTYTPLNLAYLFIQNGTFPSTTASSRSTSTTNVRTIIGATVGLAAFLVILFLFCIYRRQRNSRRYEEDESFNKSTPYIEGPSLRYTYYGGEGRQIADPGTNPAISPEDSPDRQVTSPTEELSEVDVHQDDAVQLNDVPQGSVIELPPAYSLY